LRRGSWRLYCHHVSARRQEGFSDEQAGAQRREGREKGLRGEAAPPGCLEAWWTGVVPRAGPFQRFVSDRIEEVGRAFSPAILPWGAKGPLRRPSLSQRLAFRIQDQRAPTAVAAPAPRSLSRRLTWADPGEDPVLSSAVRRATGRNAGLARRTVPGPRRTRPGCRVIGRAVGDRPRARSASVAA
jgi:hypothetical protein